MKNSYKPSKSFSNRAWADMNVRLDKELPTDERNPRLWLLWSLGLLLLIFGIIFLSENDKPRPMVPFAPAALIPVADAQKPESDENTDVAIVSNSAIPQGEKGAIISSERFTKPLIQNQNENIESVVIGQNTADFNSKNVVSKAEITEVGIAAHELKPQTNIQNEFSPQSDVLANDIIATSIASLSQRTIATLDFYPSFTENTAKATTYATIIKPAQKIADKTKLACGFGLSYGAINVRGNTWTFGGEVDLIFKNRFSLGANLAYRQRQYRKSEGQFLYIQEDELQRATGLSAMTISDYNLNYVSPDLIAFQVDQIESMEFGIHPSIRVVDNLWVEGRLSGIRARSVGTVEQDNVNTFQSDNVSSIVENAFTEWDILYGGGLRYQFNPHVGLNFRVQKIFQPESLQNEDAFQTNSIPGVTNLSSSLPLISQPLFVEMGISFRL